MKRTKHPLLGLLVVCTLQTQAADISQPYSHGEPSADEQFMLELINRARADPAAEGRFLADNKDPDIVFGNEFFRVDLARVKKDFSGYAARPPLAFNPNLLASSNRHSRDMAKKNFQEHTGTDGSTVASRIAQAGFPGLALNESIFSNYVPSTLYAHAGLNIDWGDSPLGVQLELGHRMNIMGIGLWDYREVGIGIISRSGATAEKYGALAITQDFGTRVASPVFLVGVAFFDLNRNGICDPGEGLPGIRVQPATGSFYAVTSSSGGYAIPFPIPPGRSSVTFSGGGLAVAESRDFSITGENAKADLRISTGGPFVHLEKVDGIASEKGKKGGGDAVFRIVRVGPVTDEAAIVITRPTTGGTGLAGPKDYKISAVGPATLKKADDGKARVTVRIPKNKPYADVRITAAADKLAEPTENVVFTIGTSAPYRIASPAAVTISIVK